MGKPSRVNTGYRLSEYIGVAKLTGEVNHQTQEEKTTVIPKVR